MLVFLYHDYLFYNLNSTVVLRHLSITATIIVISRGPRLQGYVESSTWDWRRGPERHLSRPSVPLKFACLGNCAPMPPSSSVCNTKYDDLLEPWIGDIDSYFCKERTRLTDLGQQKWGT